MKHDCLIFNKTHFATFKSVIKVFLFKNILK
jgi:hypothetical protein